MMRRIAWQAAVLLAVLLPAACGSSPKTHFFTLDATSPSAPAPAGTWNGPQLQVQHITLPPTLDRLSLVRASSSTRIDISNADRWAAPLDSIVRDTLSDDLRRRLPQGAVLPPDAEAPPSHLRPVSVAVQRFMGDAAGHVVLDADWRVTDGRSGHVLASGHESIQETAGSPQSDAVVVAMGRALGVLADRIAAAPALRREPHHIRRRHAHA